MMTLLKKISSVQNKLHQKVNKKLTSRPEASISLMTGHLNKIDNT